MVGGSIMIGMVGCGKLEKAFSCILVIEVVQMVEVCGVDIE